MLNGRYDTVFPYETSQVPFFDHLGTPARDKWMELSDNGHILSMETGVKASLEWFDRYLSGNVDGASRR